MKKYFNITMFFVLTQLFQGLTGCGSNTGKRTEDNSSSKVNIQYPLPSSLDSLFSLLSELPDDTNKINVLNAISWLHKYNNPDTSILLGKEALVIAEKLSSKKHKANSLGNLGSYYYIKSDYPASLDYYFQALKIDDELQNKKGKATRLSNIGLVYRNLGDYKKALEKNLEAGKIYEELGLKNNISVNLGNVGNIYSDMKDYPKALDNYFTALELSEELGNKNDAAAWLGNIGIVYGDLADYPHAFEYYFKYLKMAEELGNNNYFATALGNIGSLYTEAGNYKQAYNYLYRALAVSDSIGSKELVMRKYQMLSVLYEKSDVSLTDSIGGRVLNMEAMRLRALHYYKSYVNLRDTLFSEENKKQLVRKEMNFEFEKKEAVTKAENDKKEALAKAELKQKETQRNYFIGGFALVLALAGFIFRGYRQKQRANEVISRQKLLVEEKQKEILDSIHYAKRIQKSLLPTEKYIDKSLKNLNRN